MAIKIENLTRLPLGYVGENGSRTISIDVSAWLNEYPDALIMIQVIRPEDHYKYPAAYTIQDGVLHWTVDAGELAYAGKGFAQISLYDPESKREYKSRVVGTIVSGSLEDFNDEQLAESDPASKWVNNVLLAADRAEAAVDKMPIIGENGTWWIWDSEAGDYADSGFNSGAAIVVDSSLTQIGAAAESRTTGLKFNQLKHASVNVNLLDVTSGIDSSEALQTALGNHRTLYFPAGNYRFHDVYVDQDTVLILDPDAHFHIEKGTMLRAYNCSLTIVGGKISSGTFYGDREKSEYDDAVRTIQYVKDSHNEGIIELYGCHDCVFERIAVLFSSSPAVFQLYGDSNGAGGNRPVTLDGKSVVPGTCRDIRFNSCSFNDTLLSAIHVLYHCKNVVIDGCTFTNALRAKGIPYCYTAYTGVKSINSDKELYYTPTDGYVCRNCYVENCEGTGVDSHAASNVLYENNTFIDCDSFITAYHDYTRVRTADGWVMENIIIRNNRCVTTKDFPYDENDYPHNPCMLHNNGPIGTMRNLVFENNAIDTNFYYCTNTTTGIPWVMVETYWVDNILMRNNTFKSTADIATASNFTGCQNVDLDNNTFIGSFAYGFNFCVSVAQVGKITCKDATFSLALLRTTAATYSVVDTDNMIVDNPLVAQVTGWEFVLNRFGKLLQSADSVHPLDWTTRDVTPGYVGKNVREGQKYSDVVGNRVSMTHHRFPVGTNVYIGSDAFCVINVESNYDKTKYVYTLDAAPSEETLATNQYLMCRCPYISSYENANS